MPFFIAEISSNHNNSMDRIKKIIKSAKKSGFDAIKFQIFKIEKLFHKEILKKSKFLRNRKKWELNLRFLDQIKKECKKNNIKLGFTPFYVEVVDKLNKYADFFKIASYEILWTDLIKVCANKNKKIILSTGMANLKEVKRAYNIAKKFNKNSKISVLHCVSSYPANFRNCNLSTIETLRKELKCSVGWSDHTVDKNVINRAVNRWGAEDIELHFDIDGKGYEANIGHCWLPKESFEIISSLRKNIDIDGSKIKKPTKVELKERSWRADPSDGFRPLKYVRKKYLRKNKI